MYFIVSPKDIVTARQRDEDDHISWLLEHEMFVVSALYSFMIIFLLHEVACFLSFVQFRPYPHDRIFAVGFCILNALLVMPK